MAQDNLELAQSVAGEKGELLGVEADNRDLKSNRGNAMALPRSPHTSINRLGVMDSGLD
jgi:hypothetical protein